MSKAQVCPVCRKLNSAEDELCYSCGATIRHGGGRLLMLFHGEGSATLFLLGLCLLNFAMLVLVAGMFPVGLFGRSAPHLALIGLGAVSPSLSAVQPWRLLSAAFVHAGALHLVMNLFALKWLGGELEARYRGPRVILTFVITAVIGFGLSGLWYGPHGPLTLGASGGIFGLLGAQVGSLAVRRDPAAREYLIQAVMVGVAFGLMFSVNNAAHFGGFASGLLLGALLEKESPQSRSRAWASLLALFAAACSVGTLVLSLMTLYVLKN